MRMSQTGVLLLLLTAALTMMANLMLRAGIDAAGGFAASDLPGLLRALVRLFAQPLFSLGFVTYFLASVVWFRVVATEQLSLAYPVLVSLTFILVTGGAVIFFHEPLSLRKVAGLAVILAGIVLISFDKSIT
jgi:multidrug transporter EmrE-like cation transporter